MASYMDKDYTLLQTVILMKENSMKIKSMVMVFTLLPTRMSTQVFSNMGKNMEKEYGFMMSMVANMKVILNKICDKETEHLLMEMADLTKGNG